MQHKVRKSGTDHDLDHLEPICSAMRCLYKSRNIYYVIEILTGTEAAADLIRRTTHCGDTYTYNQDTYTIIKVKRKRIRTKKGEAEINSKRKKFGSRYSE